jgi:hypothetical protein
MYLSCIVVHSQKRPIETLGHLDPCQEAVLMHSQSSGLVGSVEESRSGSVSTGIGGSVDDGGGLHGAGDSGVGNVVGVSHDSGGNGLLDDGLAGDGHRDGHVVGGVHIDGHGHRDDVILEDGDVIRDGDLALDQDGGLDIVDLGLLGDDGGVVGNGPLEDGGHSNGEMGGGGLEDPGVVSGDVAGLSEVDLLGHDGGGLVDGGGAHSLCGSGVGGGGSGCDIGGVGDGDNRTGGGETVSGRGRAYTLGDSTVNDSTGIGSSSIGSSSISPSKERGGGGPVGCSQDER